MPIFLIATNVADGSARSEITNASSHPAPINTQETPQVTIPLSDSRTGQLQVSMYEPIANTITAGDTGMKVLYKNPRGTTMLLLNGIVVQPTFDFDAGTVAFTVHDPTIRLKHRFLSWDHVAIQLGRGITVASPAAGGDPGVDAFTGGSFNGKESLYGIPLDGTGLRVLVYDAAGLPSTALRGGTPPFGIRKGQDVSTPQPAWTLISGRYVPPPGVGGMRSDGITSGVGFTATATAGSDTLTGVSFTGATMPDGSTPTIADVLEYARIDCDSNPTLLPLWCTVVSASGTSIVMTQKATATATITNGFTTEDAIYCQVTRGDCVYDDIIDLVQAAGSFECDWVPVDADHLGFGGDAWVPGEMCELYTTDRLGTDRSQGNIYGHAPVVFVHGLNGFHLTFAPDADQLVTMDTEVGPGGQADPNDYWNKASLTAASADTYGIWQDWTQAQAAGNGDSPIANALLANRADATLTAFQYPPKFVTARIDSDKVGPYCYGDDFYLGDSVTLYAKKGHVTVGPWTARIISIGITQTDENGNCQLDLTLVPHITTKPLRLIGLGA